MPAAVNTNSAHQIRSATENSPPKKTQQFLSSAGCGTRKGRPIDILMGQTAPSAGRLQEVPLFTQLNVCIAIFCRLVK